MAARGLGFWQRSIISLVSPAMRVWTKATTTGMENLPQSGGVILVANHASHFDPLVVGVAVYHGGRWPQFLAKASLFRVPILGFCLRKIKQIPVERGSVEAMKSIDVLEDAVNHGGVVVIYPEGTTTREPDLWPMQGKSGAARLALATGAPVIPVGNWGAYRIFDPRTKKLSKRLRVPVAVTVGKPIDMSRWKDASPTKAVLEEMTEVFMLDIRDLVGELREGEPPALYSPASKR